MHAAVNDHRRGVLLVTTAMLVLSFDALLVRLAQAPAADVLFWRGLFIAASLTGVMRAVQGRWPWRELAAGGRFAVGAAIGFAMAQAFFVSAVLTTAVANVVMILTAAPLFAAAISGFVLREWVALRTWVAIVLCMAGIALVFGGSLQFGAWLGNGMALAAALIVATVFTALRQRPGISRLAMLVAAGAILALVALPWASPGRVTAGSLAILAVMGLVQMPLAQVLMTVATRYLPSAEVTVFLAIEAVFSTILVWVFLGERAPPYTLAGGGIVIAALVGHSWIALRRERVPAAAAPQPAAEDAYQHDRAPWEETSDTGALPAGDSAGE